MKTKICIGLSIWMEVPSMMALLERIGEIVTPTISFCETMDVVYDGNDEEVEEQILQILEQSDIVRSYCVIKETDNG